MSCLRLHESIPACAHCLRNLLIKLSRPINVARLGVEYVAESILIIKQTVVSNSFLDRLELIAVLPDEVLKYHRNAHFVSVPVLLLQLENCKNHLNQTVRTEPSGERLVQVFEAQELLKDQR